jgi:hypothetical protein
MTFGKQIFVKKTKSDAMPGLMKGQVDRQKGPSGSILGHSQLKMTLFWFSIIRVWQQLRSHTSTSDDI